ncbi:MAG: hypothetical protein FJY75_00855 [Candidatus Eisenbacteria bacterium]|uniref:Aryl sulfotransferase n=1 Tax=Eiseniibacteriota bacterium TaxID=2212470 RepID=A0A937X9L1_UNCEI|nr:hypothetical protein [Candidatus Eisenbacteria bacterium]
MGVIRRAVLILHPFLGRAPFAARPGAALLLAGLALTLAWTSPAHGSRPKTGRWHAVDQPSPRESLTPEQQRQLRHLESLGYLAGSTQPPAATGVTIHDPRRSYAGFNLYVSGHAPEAILVDMEGNELHRWRCEITRAWPDFEPRPGPPNHQYWRRVRLLEDGELLAIFEGIGLIKLDKDSNLLWAYGGNAHHDLDLLPDGTIYVLGREAFINEQDAEKRPVLQDFIAVLSPDGREQRRIWIEQCFARSFYAPTLQRRPAVGDAWHTNTLQILQGRLADQIPAFQAGNILLSHLMLDLISVVDPENETVVWTMTGMWRKQHQPVVCGDSTLVILDNLGARDGSRVIEFDPATQRVRWYYEGTEEQPLATHDCGSVQPLPNGNFLISESNRGRALEVTRDDEVVWEFYNPHRAGDDHQFIATLFELIRLDPRIPLDWL